MSFIALCSPGNFLAWLTELADKERAAESRSKLMVEYQRAHDRGDTREVHRLGERLRAATTAALEKDVSRTRSIRRAKPASTRISSR